MPIPTNVSRILTGLFGMASCWWMSVTLVRTWLTPMAVDEGRWVRLGVGIMALEFVLVHAGTMMAAMGSTLGRMGPIVADRPRWPLFLVSLVYVVFGVCIPLAFKSQQLFWTFLAVMIPRWVSLFLDPPGAFTQQIIRSVFSVVFYIGVVILSVAVQFPAKGLTPQVLDQVYPGRGKGIWEQTPQQALVAGAVYFFLIGLVQLITAFR